MPSRATGASWKHEPFPEARAKLAFERRFSPDERRRIELGLVPEQMEDKWFIYFEDGWVYLHRSWTGMCIYAVLLRAEGEGSAVEEAWANRDPKEYRVTDAGYDAALLGYLIDRLLLGKEAAFPASIGSGTDEKASLFRHHVVGTARSNEEGVGSEEGGKKD